LIFDAAHNPSGFEFFASRWKTQMGTTQNTAIVFGSMGDKDWPAVIPDLGTVAAKVFFAGVDHPRAAKVDVLLESGKRCGLNCVAHQNPIDAIREAHKEHEICVVLGSIALVGEVMTRLQIDPFSPENELVL
jgi:folylpolyglutamate synthase/dihydropteroate synthase